MCNCDSQCRRTRCQSRRRHGHSGKYSNLLSRETCRYSFGWASYRWSYSGRRQPSISDEVCCTFSDRHLYHLLVVASIIYRWPCCLPHGLFLPGVSAGRHSLHWRNTQCTSDHSASVGSGVNCFGRNSSDELLSECAHFAVCTSSSR